MLVDNAKNYKMATVRQKILRPILRDGLLTAEGEVWKRSRKAMAPVFTPRHIFGFAQPMLKRTQDFVERYEAGGTVDVAHDMTMLTYDILAETLFSGEIAGEPGSFASEIDRLFETMGRVDPLDLLRAPDWLPRLTRLRGRKTMAYFRKIVTDTVTMRKERHGARSRRRAGGFPDAAAARRGAGRADARARSRTTSSPSSAPATRRRRARSAGRSTASPRRRGSASRSSARSTRCWRASPIRSKWLDAMPLTRAAFEEALRLYPPAPSINREPIEPET